MTISLELLAKINALEDEKLKARVIGVLTGPGKRIASDEAIYESIVSDYMAAREHWDRRRVWKAEDAAAFAQYFQKESPEEYADFLWQEKGFNQIEARLAWSVRRLILKWMPGLDESDITGLFGKFRDHAKSDST
ncbi:hypothetical protein GLE_0197 [Lysobacter enzymogenes]|uniref:Uncharacterized protein n=1 Tax=Lysobacter enzymogenes TaxID=69 RepID=A0A0S2DAP2_LYSEN|nr:hypothetical protein [Lysobacter enzymogenes]ALN55556.1 hypothetical protein GLE_0197 [Lysobacter enzymogenes]QCW24607.1 hypothetical protein FE772_01850 [Lysobacter enzymogenes]